MNNVFTIVVRVVQDDDVAVASLETDGFGHVMGSARRHPADTPNLVLGQCVAFGRLFRNLAGHYDQVVATLMSEADEPEDLVQDPVEAEWLRQYGIPSEEMGEIGEK